MEFYDVIKNRKSVRSYSNDAIPREALARIGEAVRLAPSACNLQPWLFNVILDKKIRENICSVYTKDWLREAPAIVLVLGNKELAWKRVENTSIIEMDIGIAMEHLVLAATAEGLGTCWICAYDIKKMGAVTGILPPWEVLAISPIGYPAKKQNFVAKKSLGEIFKIVD